MIGNIVFGGRALSVAVGITMLVLLLASGAGAITVNDCGVRMDHKIIASMIISMTVFKSIRGDEYTPFSL